MRTRVDGLRKLNEVRRYVPVKKKKIREVSNG